MAACSDRKPNSRVLLVLAALLSAPMAAGAQQGWWGDVSSISTNSDRHVFVERHQLAVNDAGDAVVVWSRSGRVEAARSAATTNTWSEPVDLGPGSFGARVVMDSASNATVAWLAPEGPSLLPGPLYAARYDAGTGTWSAAVRLSYTSRSVDSHHMVVDSSGNVTVVWSWRGVFEAARYTASRGTWNVVEISAIDGEIRQDLGIDAAGNITAVFNARYSATPGESVIQALRYTAATDTWGPATTLSAPKSYILIDSPIAVDQAGNVVAIWEYRVGPPGTNIRIQTARYDAASDAWSAPREMSAADQMSRYPILAGNAAGDVVALWWRYTGITADSTTFQAAFYSAAAGTWSETTDVCPPGRYSAGKVAMDRDGNATMVWGSNPGPLQSVRYSPNEGTWSSVVDLSRPGDDTKGPAALPIDEAGNVIAYWLVPSTSGGLDVLMAARRPVDADAWSAVTEIGPGYAPSIVFDATGSATAVWVRFVENLIGPPGSGMFQVQGTRWVANPMEPGIESVTTGAGSLTVAFHAPETNEAGFAPINYEYSVDNGASWTPRVPASTQSPMVIAPLAPGVQYAVRLRAVNLAGGGLPSATGFGAPEPILRPPSGLAVASLAGNMVTIEWAAPAYSVTPTGYVVEGGPTPGAVSASVPVDMNVTRLTFAAPSDSFYVRVHALGSGERSGPSNEIRVYVGTPGPPADLTATVIDNLVTLAWTAPRNSVAPAFYVIEGGTRPGEIIASIPTGSAQTQFTFAVPYGTYFVRVHAVANGRRSTPSNEIPLAVTLAAPAAPRNLLGLVNQSSLTLSWTSPATGGPIARMILTVTGSLSTTLALPAGESFTFDGVPPGTYTFTVTAVNATGASEPSNAVTLAFPGTCSGPPGLPAAVAAARTGGLVTVSWNPPVAGPAVTGYVVLVEGTPVGVFPANVRSLSGAAGPGRYALQVAAINACGLGASSDQTIIIP